MAKTKMPVQAAQSPPVFRFPANSNRLFDKEQWINRFEIRSESSGNRTYVIAQHGQLKHWACSCRGWTTQRKCKHLTKCGLPGHEQPYDVIVVDAQAATPVAAPPSNPTVFRKATRRFNFGK